MMILRVKMVNRCAGLKTLQSPATCCVVGVVNSTSNNLTPRSSVFRPHCMLPHTGFEPAFPHTEDIDRDIISLSYIHCNIPVFAVFHVWRLRPLNDRGIVYALFYCVTFQFGESNKGYSL